MSTALSEGLLQQLVEMLGQVPRIILLILKTNDLTRSLDENLHTRLGPARTFLILARYCARTVWYEELDGVVHASGGLLWPANWPHLLTAWWSYMRVRTKLSAFETWLGIKRVFDTLMPGHRSLGELSQ